MNSWKLKSGIIAKLKQGNFDNPFELLIQTPEEIARACGLSLEEAKEIISLIQRSMGFISLDQIEKSEVFSPAAPIPTFSNAINTALNGGFYPGRIYEIYGEYRSGKTQLCYTFAVSCQATDDIGSRQNILYIDTENSFRPERIIEIAQTKYNPSRASEILDLIKVVELSNFSSQRLFFRKLYETVQREEIRLILVDSFINHFRQEVAQDFEKYPTFKNQLLEGLETLGHIRDDLGTCIVLTNQVRAEFDPVQEINVKPVAEYIVAHFASEVILLRVTDDVRHYLRIMRSQYGPEGEVEFKIGPTGLEDP